MGTRAREAALDRRPLGIARQRLRLDPGRLAVVRPETLAWVETVAGAVVETKRLTGGLTSWVHRLTTARGDIVLRQSSADAVAKEAVILTALARADVPAPRLIATSGDALLMTLVPGEIRLVPTEAWLRQMATMLARIHALDVDVPKRIVDWRSSEYKPPPDATSDVWKDVVAIVAQERTVTDARFSHGDYQHFNMLWSDEQLTGVIDWIEACLGPQDLDVGHCRLNLALLFSADPDRRPSAARCRRNDVAGGGAAA
ncbi:MAG TPA: phosphotransferase [Kofleriaceae bacterium]|nr:phosphotransferase [Kofleriaceae bacterium]